jgi:hypothetical protein
MVCMVQGWWCVWCKLCCTLPAHTIHEGLTRTVYLHCIWTYIWWFPCQKYLIGIYTIYIGFSPALDTRILTVHLTFLPQNAWLCTLTSDGCLTFHSNFSFKKRGCALSSVTVAQLLTQIFSSIMRGCAQLWVTIAQLFTRIFSFKMRGCAQLWVTIAQLFTRIFSFKMHGCAPPPCCCMMCRAHILCSDCFAPPPCYCMMCCAHMLCSSCFALPCCCMMCRAHIWTRLIY